MTYQDGDFEKVIEESEPGQEEAPVAEFVRQAVGGDVTAGVADFTESDEKEIFGAEFDEEGDDDGLMSTDVDDVLSVDMDEVTGAPAVSPAPRKRIVRVRRTSKPFVYRLPPTLGGMRP